MPDSQRIVARIENNRAATALRFLDLAHITYYAPRARLLSTNRRELHPLLFAPYIFVVEMIEGQYGPIKRSIGIPSVVLRGDRPAIVHPTVISALRKRERNGLVDLAPRMRKGTRVQITRGPFTSYCGVLSSDPSLRVKVLFDNIFSGPPTARSHSRTSLSPRSSRAHGDTL